MLLAGCDSWAPGFPEPPADWFPYTNAPPPVVNQLPGGLWYGTLSFDTSLVTEEFVAMTADDGRYRLVSVDSDVQFRGEAHVSGFDLVSSGKAFADQGVNWLNGNHVVNVSIHSSITERDAWSGTWENASGESGSFEFFYDALYEKGASTGLLESTWTGYDDMRNPAVTFTIDADGSFTGQNAMGCTSSGRFTAIDPRFNLYDVQSDIANCSLAGTYTGFAMLADIVAPNDILVLSIDDGARAILLGLER